MLLSTSFHRPMPPVVQFCSRKTSYLHRFETAEFSKYAERVIKDDGIFSLSSTVTAVLTGNMG